MKKKIIKITVTAFLFCIMALFTSCKNKIMGYSVVLWSIPEYQIQDGDIVPVYIKSKISNVYVIGTSEGEKVEVKLWQLTEPVKKSKIKGIQDKYLENKNTYAAVKIDGLPAREEPVNTAKQVYRMRKNEIIKILYKGEGQAVMSGKKALEGDWYRILTSDGTQAWCFSYNLNLYQADIYGNPLGGESVELEEVEDSIFPTIIDKVWYPDAFKSLINSGNIDLKTLNPAYNFVIDTEKNKVNFNLKGIHESWDYKGYEKVAEKQYKLVDIPIIIIYKNPEFIVLRYTGDSGKPQELNFVIIKEDINSLIESEKGRRAQAYNNVFKKGPIFTSSNYGKITLTNEGTFKWTNYKLLVPTVVSNTARNPGVGTVEVKYAVSKKLQSNYDGVLTFNFEGMKEEVNFLYKVEENGLRLEDATKADFKGILVTERGSSPTIIYFTTN